MTEAEVARDIFQRMAAGSTAVEECRRLTMLDVNTARRYHGGKIVTVSTAWGPARLTNMLRNPVYIGCHVFRSRHGIIERAVPALVDQETWEQAKPNCRKIAIFPRAERTALICYVGSSGVGCAMLIMSVRRGQPLQQSRMRATGVVAGRPIVIHTNGCIVGHGV